MQGGNIGNGIKFGFSELTSSPFSFKPVEQVLDVTPPTRQADKIDNTVSNINKLKSNMPGMHQVTDTIVKMLRDSHVASSPNQNRLEALNVSQATVYCRIEIPTDPDLSTTLWRVIEYYARVGGFKESAPLTNRQECEVPFVFTGQTWVSLNDQPSIL
jgi:hypothetical protein